MYKNMQEWIITLMSLMSLSLSLMYWCTDWCYTAWHTLHCGIFNRITLLHTRIMLAFIIINSNNIESWLLCWNYLEYFPRNPQIISQIFIIYQLFVGSEKIGLYGELIWKHSDCFMVMMWRKFGPNSKMT